MMMPLKFQSFRYFLLLLYSNFDCFGRSKKSSFGLSLNRLLNHAAIPLGEWDLLSFLYCTVVKAASLQFQRELNHYC